MVLPLKMLAISAVEIGLLEPSVEKILLKDRPQLPLPLMVLPVKVLVISVVEIGLLELSVKMAFATARP